MEFLTEYGLFLAKTVTLVVALVVAVAGIATMGSRHKEHGKERLDVKNLNDKYRNMEHTLEAAILSKKDLKGKLKAEKKERKAKEKKPADDSKRRIYVLNFHGDIRGSAVANLREEITAVLTVARKEDEVLLRLESAGGVVHAYGLAASQLSRIRNSGIPLTIAVDKIAASGGYLMACVADKIVAAPFAIIGSIGVLAQIPNFNRLLKQHNIDFEQFTAGEYKRTVTLFGETTEKGRAKMKQDIEQVHTLFKDFVLQQREDLEIDKVSTGEHWHGIEALQLKLVDELRTSDDYLLEAKAEGDIYEITYSHKKPIAERLSSLTSFVLDRLSINPGAKSGDQII